MSAHRRNGSIAQFPSEILRNTCAQAVEDYKFVCSSPEENVKLEGELREIYFKSGSSTGNMIYFICCTSITRWSLKIICF